MTYAGVSLLGNVTHHLVGKATHSLSNYVNVMLNKLELEMIMEYRPMIHLEEEELT